MRRWAMRADGQERLHGFHVSHPQGGECAMTRPEHIDAPAFMSLLNSERQNF